MVLADAGGAAAGIVILFFIMFSAGLYFIPLIVAVVRKVPNVGSIGVINFFLGWTLVGWVVALAMAARSAPTPPAGFRGSAL
jgi:T4 superinfection immunity protein